ncbi:LOW QUALITY PROTEIN: hypothetical protein Cgig2_033751 [Carnegiea gigantea]|uniref:Uncharacterized protein n=1 Tax=Carnegiea gigantea TaxID=171969 RepID=A0A9Q1K0E5_9CARY|nr:LOW QUALITY PROTEIN: hypothetical protein Cgig2_033751 [Carnegiea gigantea]
MASIHPGGFGNWALVTDDPMATDYSWASFETWTDRCGVAFPPLPLPKDFQALCPSYELAMVEEAAKHFELPELPQVIFYAMLLDETERLGVLHGRALQILGSALIELRDRIFETRFRAKAEPEESSGTGQQEKDSEPEQGGENSATEGAASTFDDDKQGNDITVEERKQRMLSTPLSPFIMAFPPLYDTREMAEYRRATRPPRPLPKYYHVLCPRFSLPEAERAAANFELPKIVQATFYAMLLNEAVELGVFYGRRPEVIPCGLRWSCFEAWMSRVNHELREAKLRQRTITVEVCGPSDGQQESSGSNGPPLPLDFRLQKPRGEVGVARCSLRGCNPLDISLLSS